MVRSFPVILVVGLLAGCGQQTEQSTEVAGQDAPVPETEASAQQEDVRQLDLDGQIYAVPAQLLSAVRLSGELTFVRITHPDFAADLVFDKKSNELVDQKGMPQIFSINDGPYPNLSYHERSGRVVVCRTGMAARTGCGIRFEHRGVSWALLFPLGKLDDAGVLLKEASDILDSFTNEGKHRYPRSETTAALSKNAT